jgi:hypothetical protein
VNVDGLCGKRITSTGETIVYSDINDEKHHGGVAIIMNRNVTIGNV